MTPERLRELYGETNPRAAAKVIHALDHHCRSFIEHSSFLVLATSDGTEIDISPKGDPAGFVKIEDDNNLLLPDRLGNNRLDGMLNILQHPNVALLFMIPTVSETLRVNGTAQILEDPALCDEFVVNGKAPKTVMRITADEIYTHCGKALIRGALWKPENWPGTRPVATLHEMIRDHAVVEVESTEQSAVDELYEKTMY